MKVNVGQSLEIQHTNNVSQAVYVENYLNKGRLDHVYEVKVHPPTYSDTGSLKAVTSLIEPGRYAMKVPISKVDITPLAQEFKTLARIENLYRAVTPKPTPQVYYLDDSLQPGFMLIEYIAADELYAVYQRKFEQASSSVDRLQAELFAWRVAQTYVELMQRLFLELHIVVNDRKRDTFLYATEQDRLVVMDWNVVETVDARNIEAAANTLGVFGQNWYTMMTKLKPHGYEDIHDDIRWNDLSIASRLFLIWTMSFRRLTRYTSPQKLFDAAQERLSGLINWMTAAPAVRIADYETKVAPLLQGQHVSRSEKDNVLAMADMLQRRGLDSPKYPVQATFNRLQQLSDTILHEKKLEARLSDVSGADEISIDIDPIAQSVNALLNEIADFIRGNRRAFQEFRVGVTLNRVIQLLDNPYVGTLEKSHELQQAIDKLNQRLNQVFINDTLPVKLPVLTRYLNVYHKLAEINVLLEMASTDQNGQELLVAAYRDLIVWGEDEQYAGIYERARLDSGAIRKRVEQLSADLQRGVFIATIRDKFVEAVRADRVQHFATDVRTAMVSPVLSVYTYQLLESYLLLVEQLHFIFQRVYFTDSDYLDAINQLTMLIAQFPELRREILQHHVVQHIQQRYTALRTSAQAESASLVDKQRVLAYASRLRELFGGYGKE